MTTERYTSKAKTTTIKISSRASIKVGESFFTVEYTEERTVPQTKTVQIEKERSILWDVCNNEVDKQIEDILKTYKK